MCCPASGDKKKDIRRDSKNVIRTAYHVKRATDVMGMLTYTVENKRILLYKII